MKQRLFRVILAATLLAAAACREEVIHDLDEMRANQVQLLLSTSGISAHKVRSGTQWAIAVDGGDVEAALRTVEQSRVLRRELVRSAEESKGLLDSREERAAQTERQLAISLEQTLERIPGVLEARVHLHLAALSPFEIATAAPASSAGVLLIVADEHQLDPAQITKIVAGASGVAAAAVSVVTSKITLPEPRKENRLQPTRTVSPLQVQGSLLMTAICLFAALLVVRKQNRRKRLADLLPENDADDESNRSKQSDERSMAF